MFRLLTSLPPGQVRFTIIDPIGIGRNFGAFMHLADFDGALVNQPGLDRPPPDRGAAGGPGGPHGDGDAEVPAERVRDARGIQRRGRRGRRAVPGAGRSPTSRPSSTRRPRPGWPRSPPGACPAACCILVAADLVRAPARRTSRSTTSGRTATASPGTAPASPGTTPTSADIRSRSTRPRRPNSPPGRSSASAPRRRTPSASRSPSSSSPRPTTPGGRATAGPGSTSRSARRARPSGSTSTLGQGTSQHVLLAGRTGSGKSTLMHALITNLALELQPRRDRPLPDRLQEGGRVQGLRDARAAARERRGDRERARVRPQRPAAARRRAAACVPTGSARPACRTSTAIATPPARRPCPASC